MKRNKTKSRFARKSKTDGKKGSTYANKCQQFGYGKSMIKRRSTTIKGTGQTINVPIGFTWNDNETVK